MFDSQHDVLSHLEGQKFLGEVVNGRLVLTPLKAEALVSDAKETAIETLLETLYLQQGHDAVLSELARLSRQWAVVPQESAGVNDE